MMSCDADVWKVYIYDLTLRAVCHNTTTLISGDDFI
jgi:hypothetical protein